MLPVESHAMTVVVPAGAAFGEVALHCAVHCKLPRVHVFQVNLRLMIQPLLGVADHPRHAGFHVIEQMTMKHPVSLFVGEKFDGCLSHWRHINRVLERRKLALAVEQPEEVAVQMQRMMHHRVVDESHAHHLTAGHANGAFLLHRLAVERPHITLHVAGEAQLQLAHGGIGRHRCGFPCEQAGVRRQWPCGLRAVGVRVIQSRQHPVHAVHLWLGNRLGQMLSTRAKEHRRVARAVLCRGAHLVAAALRHGHDHIVRFAHAHQQSALGKRPHRHSVCRYHRQRAGGRVHIKIRGGTRID